MTTAVSMVGICVAVAIGSSSVAFAGMPVTSQPISSNARINAMMKKLDRFERRMDRQESILYVSRERSASGVAQTRDIHSSYPDR